MVDAAGPNDQERCERIGVPIKYLIAKFPSGSETGILFSPVQSHQTIANGLKAAGAEITAGGYVELRGHHTHSGDRESISILCHGESLSVAVRSRGDKDAAIIRIDLHWPD